MTRHNIKLALESSVDASQPRLCGGSADEPQGFHTDRASDRRRDHRHFGRDRDSEVREHERKSISRVDDVGPAELHYSHDRLLHGLGELHEQPGYELRDDQRRGWSHDYG